jgi:transcription termination factor NusB
VSAPSARHLALDALVRIEDGAFAHILVPELLRRSRLAPRDRGLVTELVYGTVRMQRALDFQLAKVSKQAIDDLEPEVRAGIRLGAYQLLLGIPSHAAVGETVEVVASRQRGYVNGVLRALARTGPPWSWPAGREIADIGIGRKFGILKPQFLSLPDSGTREDFGVISVKTAAAAAMAGPRALEGRVTMWSLRSRIDLV